MLSAVVFLACPVIPGSDGGTGGGSGGGSGATGGGSATDARIYGAANALVAQGDAFVVVGMKTLGSGASAQDDFLVARMLADGGRDDSFGDGGSVTLAWPAYHFVDPLDAGFDMDLETDIAFAVAAQGSKLLVAGTVASQGGQSGAYGIARFSADGVLDPTFGTGGRADLRFGPLVGGTADQLAQRADGTLYVAGFVSRAVDSTNNTDFGVVRFSADGVVDTTFGTNGAASHDFGKNEVARSIAFQGNQVLLAGGDDFAVTRLNDDGTLDTTFGSSGVATSAGGFGHVMRVLAGGEILVAGSERRPGTDQPWDIKLVRYTANGQLDASFGTAGVLKLAFDEHQISVLSLDVLADGRLVLAMTAGFGTTGAPYAAVARLSADGTLDTTFGTAGLGTVLDGLPLLGVTLPASPNHALLSGGRLHYVDTNTFGSPVYVLYGSTAL